MPLSSPRDHLVVPDRVVTRAIDGATVLLNIETGQSFLLDDIGARAWTVLTASPSIQDAYDTLLAEYRVEPEQLSRDLDALVDELDVRGLLEIRRA